MMTISEACALLDATYLRLQAEPEEPKTLAAKEKVPRKIKNCNEKHAINEK